MNEEKTGAEPQSPELGDSDGGTPAGPAGPAPALPTVQPSIGRIVHTAGDYLQSDGQPYAAIITRVHDAERVTLQVFDEGEGPGVMHSAVFGSEWTWPPGV